MNNMVSIIKHFIFGVAFLCVMGGTGGFLGAIGGVIAGLLGQTVLGITSSMVMFMPMGITVGALAAMLLGVALVRQPERKLAWQPGIPSGAVEQQ